MNSDSNSSLADPLAVRRAFDRAAETYRGAAGVLDIVADRLEERLDLLVHQPAIILDAGCGNGDFCARLQKRYPRATVIGVDVSERMLLHRQRKSWFRRSASFVCADAAVLPFSAGSIDLVVSSMLLPWSHDPAALFREIARIMKPGGAFLFSTAGPYTLQEYRAQWQVIDNYPHSFGLYDMHDLGDAMLEAGFDAPVMDREDLDVTYSDLQSFEDELRHLGLVNVAEGRRRGLLTPRLHRRLQSADPEESVIRPSPATLLTMTLELVQGHGWKADQSGAHRSDHGADTYIAVDAIGKYSPSR